MSPEFVLPGGIVKIRFFPYSGTTGIFITKAISVVIQRVSDKFYWDGNTFDASFSTNVMVEQTGNIFKEGTYEYAFVTPATATLPLTPNETYDWSIKFDNGATLNPPIYAKGRIIATSAATTENIWAKITADAMNKIADHTLRRHAANARLSPDGDSVDQQALLGAMCKLHNTVTTNFTTKDLTVFEEDGATVFYIQTMTTDANATPIVGTTTN